jgi:branched-chain amino acid transport system permease protein
VTGQLEALRIVARNGRQQRFLRLLLVVCAVVAAGVLPSIGGEILFIASRIAVYSILAVSLDRILGYGGLVSFGHAVYFGVGAYVTYALVSSGYTNGLLHLVAAVAVSSVAAFVIGMLSMRTRGIYFVMLTFAFAQMIFFVALGLRYFGGEDGISLPHHSKLGDLLNLGDASSLFYVALAARVLVSCVCVRIVKSSFGVGLKACRQNDLRLQTLGVATYWYKVAAFVVAGAFAGLAGVLAANLNAYISPTMLNCNVSPEHLLMIVLGGMGTLYGPIIGVAIYMAAETVISNYTDHWMLFMGAMLTLVALFLRRGVIGVLFPGRLAD